MRFVGRRIKNKCIYLGINMCFVHRPRLRLREWYNNSVSFCLGLYVLYLRTGDDNTRLLKNIRIINIIGYPYVPGHLYNASTKHRANYHNMVNLYNNITSQ